MSQANQQEPASRLRLLHWNIHSWRDDDGTANVEAVANLITETRPQVVSLVEVDEPWGMPESLATLADLLGYTWLFAPSFEYGHDAPRGGFGNALLTTLPVLAVQQWQLLWPTRVYDGSEPSEQRAVLLARLDVSDRPLWVGTTHLPRSDADARRAALDRLLTLTGKLGEPWALLGDFNAPASAWLPTGQSLSVSPDVPTHPAHEPTEAIDYCVVSPGLMVEAQVLATTGSDHLAVLAVVGVET